MTLLLVIIFLGVIGGAFWYFFGKKKSVAPGAGAPSGEEKPGEPGGTAPTV